MQVQAEDETAFVEQNGHTDHYGVRTDEASFCEFFSTESGSYNEFF